MSDVIHSPDHYTQYPVQPIEISRHLGFCLGNVVKYVLRAPFKGGIEDCDKALKYLEWEEQTPQACISLADRRTALEKIESLSDHLHGLPGIPWMEPVTEHQADFLDCLQGYLEHEGLHLITRMRNYVAKLADAIEVPHCRVCGCTDLHACEGGCSWVEEDLCSACVPGISGISAFLAENCVAGPGLRLPADRLYSRYLHWMNEQERSGLPKLPGRQFSQAVQAEGYVKVKSATVYWDGLGLAHDEQG